MASFEIAIEKRFPLEGGFQNHANDSANYCDGNLIGTNLGISAVGYKAFYGVCPTVAQMMSLTKDQAKTIFKNKFWDVINGDKIKNQSVSELMFLYEIGNPSTLSDLKKIANDVKGTKTIVEDDSQITDSEIEIINSLDQQKFHETLKQWRIDFYYAIVASNPSKGVFLQGWLNGIEKYIYVPGSTMDLSVKKKS